MKPLSERLSDIRHARLELSPGTEPLDTDPHRPELQVFAGMDDDEKEPVITLNVGALFGQPQRFSDLRPLEARKLVDMILEMVRAVEREIVREQADAAINAETAQIIKEIREAPDRPASHTDAFGDQREYDDERQFGWGVP